MKVNKRRLWTYVLLAVVSLVVLYYFAFVVPGRAKYRQTLQSLRPEQVRSLRLRTDDRVANEIVTKERVLAGDAASRFLLLLSEAKPVLTDHRSGGWACLVDIQTTTDIPRFIFIVRSTGRHGVQFDLNSRGLDGWNYGTLRNDALGPFIEELFRNAERTSKD